MSESHKRELQIILSLADYLKENYVPMSVIDDIKAEIEAIEINGQVDEHTMFIRTGEQVKNMALEIIDKYTKEQTE